MSLNVDSDGIPIVPESMQLYKCVFLAADCALHINAEHCPPYSSYVTDPPYALLFTYVWVSAAGVCVLLALPRLLRSIRNGRFVAGMKGISWNYNGASDYQPITNSEKVEGQMMPAKATRRTDRLRALITALATWSLYSPPYLRLDIGQSTCPAPKRSAVLCLALIKYIVVLVLLGYLTILLICINKDAQLLFNSNRAGMHPPGQLRQLCLSCRQ